MTLKKIKKAPEPPKLTLLYMRYQQIEKERQKAEAIERMIEAKVSLALRLMAN